MAAEFSQTQKFYTLFNTLETQRVQMLRENSMLNSILEGLPVGKTTGQAQKEHFVRQLEALVREVEQCLEKTRSDLRAEEAEKAKLSAEGALCAAVGGVGEGSGAVSGEDEVRPEGGGGG